MLRSTPSIVLLAALVGPPVHASIVIDDFVAPMSAVADGGVGDTDLVSAAAPSAIGGWREIFVEKTGGVPGQDVRADVNPVALERFNHSQNGSQRGYSITTWDANGEGLGGIDLTADSQFVIGVDTAEATNIIFTLEDADSANSAMGTLAVPDVAAFTELILPFSDFTPSGGTLNDIFDSVDSIMMEIDGRNRAGLDVVLTKVRTDVIPEPGTLAIWAVLGSLGLFVVARRRVG